MKGINLKKIGAIVAGATILASSVAFAGLMYENTELVDANGQPVAKVVLGSGSAASDGAVAGAIAAKLASAAYKKTTLTAAVAADATGTCGATGNGTCAISNEHVTLEVTVPGATAAGVHEFATLIGDYIDRELMNRDNTGTDDNYGIVAASETDADANPFDTEGGTVLTHSDEDMYRVASDNFQPFVSKTITDPQSGNTYSEMQSVWVKGNTILSTTDNAIESNPNLLVYQVKFDESTHTGIPVCTEDSNSDKDWSDCAITDSEYTGKHRVKIGFLGSDWIITEVTPDSTTALDNSDDVASDGGTLKLAKESVYGIINVGDSMTSTDGQLKIRLDDISTPVGATYAAPAIVSFIDANGNVISQDQIAPGATVKKTVGGKTYKVRVYQTAPGYTFGAKWAEMAMLENELELKDGDTVDDDNNDAWNVELLWKNKEGSAATPGTTDVPDTLRGVLLYKETFDELTDDVMMAGDSVSIIAEPVAYKLTYKGLDLTSSDYDTLKYSIPSGGSLTRSLGGSESCTLASGEYIKVTSGVDEAFRLDDGVDYGKAKEFYYMLDSSAGTGSSSCTAGTLDPGDVVMLKTGSTNTYVLLDVAGSVFDVQYKTAGTSGTVADGGVIEIDPTSAANPLLSVVEDIGKIDTDDHVAASLDLEYDGSDFVAEGSGDTDKVTFGDIVPSGIPTDFGYTDGNDYDEGKFISPRGSKFDSSTSTTAQFKIATKVGKAKYEFATSEAAAAGAETTTLILSEGQTGTVGDVTIKAKSIDETVGACAATGGSATCTVPKDQITAVIMPNNAASVDAVVPYAVNPKLVVLDKDAAATTTGVLITVGGDKVNSVTADAMAGAGIDFTATPVVVKQVGNKIIVAGLTADDTITAGDQFLAAVKAA